MKKHVTAFQTDTAVQCNCNCSATLTHWNKYWYQSSLSTVVVQKSDWLKVIPPYQTCPMCLSYLPSGWVSNIPYSYQRRKTTQLTVAHSLRINWNPDYIAASLQALVLCTHWTNKVAFKKEKCAKIMAILCNMMSLMFHP